MTTVPTYQTATCADCTRPIHRAGTVDPGWVHDQPLDVRVGSLHYARPADPYPLPETAGPGAGGDDDLYVVAHDKAAHQARADTPDGPSQFGGWSPAGTAGPPVPCPCGGTAGQHEAIRCPGCRGDATPHADGSVTCHDYGHMTPQMAANAQRVKELVGRLKAGQITAHQATEEMRGWTS